MATDNYMFQYLKEKIDKGFPDPKYPDYITDGNIKYVPRASTKVIDNPAVYPFASEGDPAEHRVAMFFDGPFFPIRNGACYTIYNLMRALSENEALDVNFYNCYRGWDEVDAYYNQAFNTTFLSPTDYYTMTGVLEKTLRDQRITIAHFFDTEVLISIAPLLKQLGIQIVLETQNIDHVLLERLHAPMEDTRRAMDIQAEAIKTADYNLFRSSIDKDWGLKLGATVDNSGVYNGGIFVDDFSFKPRIHSSKLVFLGHMFYQPNENALHHIVSQVMPKLPDEYSLTIIGITPPKLLEKYHNEPRVTFLRGVDDLSDALLNYDIALAPLMEGSGTRLKLLDYLASGLPIIATPLAAEGLDPEILSFMTIEDNLNKFHDRIKDIAIHPLGYQERAVHGRQYVEDNYDWPGCTVPFLNAYKKLSHDLERA